MTAHTRLWMWPQHSSLAISVLSHELVVVYFWHEDRICCHQPLNTSCSVIRVLKQTYKRMFLCQKVPCYPVTDSMFFLAQFLVCMGLVQLLKSAKLFLCLYFAHASQWLESVSVSFTLDFLPMTDRMAATRLNPHLCYVPRHETLMSVWGPAAFIPSAVFCVHVSAVSLSSDSFPRWGTVDAEIKVSSLENPELRNVLHLKPVVGSEYSHACFAHCQEFLPCPNFYLPGPFTFFSESFYFLTVLVLASTVSLVLWVCGIK